MPEENSQISKPSVKRMKENRSETFITTISSYIDSDEIIELTAELIKKETVNPPGNEYLAKEVIVNSLERLKARIEVIEGEKGRTNILGYVGEGEPSVAIIAHLDVVPAGNGWKSNPFSARIRDGRIYGRGALDNKGPYAAAWAGVKAILESSLPFKGTIILGAVADEERGSRLGMEFLLKKGFSPSFAIIPDVGRIDEAVIGEKGLIWLKISSRGKAAHACNPGKGENAIYKMADFLSAIRDYRFKGDFHPLFSEPTLNLGRIEGGEAPNMVADKCEAILDIRYPLGMKSDDILTQLKNLAEEKQLKIEMERVNFSQPHIVEQNSPLVEAFCKAGKRMGMNLKLGTTGGNTIAKNLYFKGVPSITHSPAEEDLAHQANEYVKVDNLVRCAKLWAGVIYELIGDK